MRNSEINKIIGFLINQDKESPEIDFFKVGLKTISLKHGEYYIHLWGIGEVEKCTVVREDSKKYSLAFPFSDNLLDRNVVIYFRGNDIIVENDWLGAIPVFYNSKAKSISSLFNFCVADKAIDLKGLTNFFNFGYTAFEQTLFRDVKSLRHYTKLVISQAEIKVVYKSDPVLEESFAKEVSKEEEVVAAMQEYIDDIEEKTDGEIVIPTSGGLDSRLLNYLVRDKSRIKTFTYGLSKKQEECFEVVYAEKISEIFSTDWAQIELTDFNQYMDKWFNLYGGSSHLHGMYHIEFYSKILERNKYTSPILCSGVFGDHVSGSANIRPVSSLKGLQSLSYSHGLNLNAKYFSFPAGTSLQEAFLKNEMEALNSNYGFRVISSIRMKIMLLSYLTQLPEYFGMPVFTPFLNFKVMKLSMNLPKEVLKNRAWEKKFIKQIGLDIDSMNLPASKTNSQDYDTMEKSNFDPLDVELLKEYVDEKRMLRINKLLEKVTKLSKLESWFNGLMMIPEVGGVLRRLGFPNKYLRALYDYNVIKALEKSLK